MLFDGTKKIDKYFAYGSNMDIKQFKDRIGRKVAYQKAVLKDYKVTFNKLSVENGFEEGKGNVVTEQGEFVEGVVYDVCSEDIEKLNSYESYPYHYDIKILPIILDDDSTIEAYVFIAKSEKVKDNLKPTKEYLSHFLAGEKFLSKEYYEKLKQIETINQ